MPVPYRNSKNNSQIFLYFQQGKQDITAFRETQTEISLWDTPDYPRDTASNGVLVPSIECCQTHQLFSETDHKACGLKTQGIEDWGPTRKTINNCFLFLFFYNPDFEKMKQLQDTLMLTFLDPVFPVSIGFLIFIYIFQQH